jgi:CDP-paratose 2-epimerase
MKTLVSATDEFEKILGVNNDPYPKIGFFECFQKDDYTHVENTIKDLSILGIKDLKIEVSYSDYKNGGSEWYDWLVAKLSSELNLLVSIPLYSKGIVEAADSYTAFIDTILKSYNQIDIFEFRIGSNIPGHNPDPVDENYDQLLTEWIHTAHLNAKKIILGGINPYNIGWLGKIRNGNLLKSADIIGVSAFPEVFDLNWKGWNLEIDPIENLLKECNSNAEVWITETGYSTWRNDDQKQILRFIDVVKNNFNRIYWKSLYDLSSRSENRNESIQDQREYFYGIKKANGLPKLLYRMLSQHKPSELEQMAFLRQASNLRKNNLRKGILITGGAGFIGTNLANRLLNQGKRVIIYDNLSRPGVENNLNWQLSTYPDLEIMIADVADFHSLQRAVNEAEHIFHFAAQVAVTSSLQLPYHDFQVNAGGTINVLEAIRQSRHKPSLVFTSTNKVYGDLSNVELKSDKKRYFPVNKEYFRNGINEEYPLNFLSPYGNSKGCADQYVLDYSRSFGLEMWYFE